MEMDKSVTSLMNQLFSIDHRLNEEYFTDRYELDIVAIQLIYKTKCSLNVK